MQNGPTGTMVPFILRPAALLVAKCDCLWRVIDFSKGLKVCCSFKLLMGALGLLRAHRCPWYRPDWKMCLIISASEWLCLLRSPGSLEAPSRSSGFSPSSLSTNSVPALWMLPPAFTQRRSNCSLLPRLTPAAKYLSCLTPRSPNKTSCVPLSAPQLVLPGTRPRSLHFRGSEGKHYYFSSWASWYQTSLTFYPSSRQVASKLSPRVPGGTWCF